MRIVLAEDELLLSEGMASLLERSGFEVVGQAGDAAQLLGYLPPGPVAIATYTPWPAPSSTKSRILCPDRAVLGRNPIAGLAAISSA